MHTVEWVFSGVGVVILVMLGTWLRNRYWPPKAHQHATEGISGVATASATSSPTTVLRKSTHARLDHWLNATVRVKKGDYYPSEAGYRTVRIAVTDIRLASLPDKWGQVTKNQPAVEVEIDLGGGVIFGGSATVSLGVNKHLLPRVAFEESAESIYAFHTKDDYFSFIRICVTHINIHDACADFNIVQASLTPHSS